MPFHRGPLSSIKVDHGVLDPITLSTLFNMETTTKEIAPTALQTNVPSTVDPALLAQGLDLIRLEKEMTFRQAMRLHWRAVVWSMVLSMALVMDGFDGAIVSFLSCVSVRWNSPSDQLVLLSPVFPSKIRSRA